ncbi:alpha/beta hydrolase [Rhodococcus sp. 05-2254-6]|uniref:alpha/beta hydrolase n=1 Tax=Nocardiaceae TaxID=85025 RepID=UPI00055C638F|nr:MULTISPECIES: alpha/beta hydrolase [Rhodococcus]OZE26831.1 alpha/beta hydrolase [Rhodococcus sp. 05-2254-6]OZE87849.1 alpha/beta hydrolase [Rhodococcus sp. 15-649-2-2]OZE89199.1 alpha/beta hydrolase [Rhodococcus sp. 15-2388-1-1a]
MAQEEGDLTFSPSTEVTRTPVRYKNRYGIVIAADLYTPKDVDRSVPQSAIVIGPPYGGVKEQSPGVYANELARRGFVALAFDPSFNGESGGESRHASSAEIFAEDFSAGVDYLGSLGYVDRNRIGAVGICGSGGFALNAAQVDPRIKAVATSALYDINRIARGGWLDSQTDQERRAALQAIAAQRWLDVDSGEPALTPVFPSEFNPDAVDPVTAEFHEYYVTDRGRHPRSIGGFTVTSSPSHINFGALAHLPDISPRPILLITGEHAHSRYFSDTVYEQAAEPKELVVVPGARHIDFYDRTDLIPFDKISQFFSESFVR